MVSKVKQFYYKKNRLQQLRGFYYTVLTGSLSKAAQKMDLSQSSITLQIQSLERDLKTKIFERNSKPLKLTEDGALLYEKAAFYLQGIDGLYEEFLSKKSKKKSSRISIAVHHVAISRLLPQYIEIFSKKYPETEIDIKNIAPALAIEKLKNDELDLIFYPNLDLEESCEIFAKKCFSYDPLLIMHKNHPLAKNKKVNLNDISKYNTVRIEESLVILPLFNEVFKKFGFKSNIKFENADWEIIKSFVKAGIGLGFVSSLAIDKNDDLVVKKLNDFFPTMDYQIAVRKGHFLYDELADFISLIDKDFLKEFKKLS